MSAPHPPGVTGYPELAYQLEHPSVELIQARALEVFGTEELAQQWMITALPILNQQTPAQYAESGDASKQREVLMILVRIDYGMFG